MPQYLRGERVIPTVVLQKGTTAKSFGNFVQALPGKRKRPLLGKIQ